MREPDALFDHGGEMGARMAEIEWSRTPLGPVHTWPQSLKTCVRIVLTSRQPMFVWWGPSLINLYNDAYVAILGGKHPRMLAQPASLVWAEIWDQIRPRAESAMRGNEGTYDEALMLLMDRNGYQEETYYTFSYSPVPTDEGGTGGILCANTDDTQRIIGGRQLATLRELAARTADAKTREDACAASAAGLRINPSDIPFALIYLPDAQRSALVLAGAEGVPLGSAAAPRELSVHADAPWPFAEVVRAQRPVLVHGIDDRFPGLPTGVWKRRSSSAMLLPFTASGDKGARGVLVAGLNPFRKLDDGYRGFLDLVAGQIGASVANAHAHEEERRRVAVLAEIDRAKTAFFSNISHEFRTPLTLMLGPTEAALAALDGELRGEDLAMVHRNQLRLLKLVNTLLDFSRIEAGRVEASYEPVDLAALTADVASTFRSAIERGGLRFVVDCPPVPEPVFVDRDMWEKIVLNLLSNAFKFTFEGEIVVTLRVTGAGKDVELSVSDTGVGIPEHEIERVFDRFHRIEGTRSRTHEGSGIGLALMSDLAKLQGGRVGVASTVGRGSTFTVSLPLGSRHLPADRVRLTRTEAASNLRTESFVQEALRWLPSSGRAPEAASARGGAMATKPAAARLLVADDNADMREYLARLLRHHWTVETVMSGDEALESARRSPPDLLLTDVMMPGMDGIELVRAFRSDPRIAGTPIIVLSARAGEGAADEALRLGADDYLVKPFSATALVVRVESQLASARAKAAARDEAEKLRHHLYSLFMAGPAALSIVRGDDFRIEIANGAMLSAWGKSELVIGKPLLEGVPELKGQGFDGLLRDVMRSGTPHHGRATLARIDRGGGTLDDHYFDFTYTPIRERDGASSGVLIIAFEVSEQVRARRAAEQARGEAEDANRAKDEFLAMLGHELRNPLAPIVTALDLLRQRDPDSDEAARVVIERQVGHMVRLIDDLFDVSRITRGKVELKKHPVEMSIVVAEAIEIASPLLEQANHTLTVDVPKTGLVVDGDATRLAQVVSNLVSNAAKYTEAHGSITIRATHEASPNPADTTEEPGSDAGWVVVEVIDTGIGIAPEVLPHVFDVFMQESQAVDRARGGLGLGLAIVRNLVEAHGGTVSTRSPGKGKGSTFTVRLPAAVTRAQTEPVTPAPPVSIPRPKRRHRILVVDDNEDASALLAIYLRRLGHSVQTVYDGPSALRTALELLPEVAFVDIGLPVMDGYELARRLRREPSLAGLRLVAVTGYGQPRDKAASQAAGFDVHLVKPVERARFEALLEELDNTA